MQDKALSKVFSENFRARRENLGYTQTELAQELNRAVELNAERSGDKAVIRPYTNRSVYQWEHGHIPRAETMKVICDVLRVTQDYLFGREDILPETKSESLHKLENAKELLLYDDEPLYILPNNDITNGFWVIDDVYHKLLSNPMRDAIPFEKVDFENNSLFTRNPFPPILSLEDAKKADLVYVYPVLLSKKERVKIQGWCAYNRDTRSFVKKDLTISFPEGEYGQSYFACKDLPSYIL